MCGRLEQAAALLGAAWSLADALGVRFLAHHLYAERVRDDVRIRLSSPAFKAAWTAGAALTLDVAIAEARDEIRHLEATARPSQAGTHTVRVRLIYSGFGSGTLDIVRPSLSVVR